MIVVLSDTHGQTGTNLAGRARDAVADADVVLHAGDFTTPAVLDAFYDAAPEFYAVHGNADEAGVRDRLPSARTVDAGGVRFAVRHRPEGGQTGLAMFGRERGADVVVYGHTHQPTVVSTDAVTLLNPGSHADPRGNPAAHAELTPDGDGGLAGELRDRSGDVLRAFEIP